MRQHLTSDVPRLRDVSPGLPAALDEAVQRCLAKEPTARWRDPIEFSNALTAAGLAKALGIRVYTVGVGTEGKVRIPVGGQYQFIELPIDEKMLRRVAAETGGYYFRATDTASFEEALRRIGDMDATPCDLPALSSFQHLMTTRSSRAYHHWVCHA